MKTEKILATLNIRKPKLSSDGKELRGLCPFHKEKTPSFSINLKTLKYFCFSCKAKGVLSPDALDLDYDAIEALLQEENEDVTIPAYIPAQEISSFKEAYNFMAKRNMLDVIDVFNLKYSPEMHRIIIPVSCQTNIGYIGRTVLDESVRIFCSIPKYLFLKGTTKATFFNNILKDFLVIVEGVFDALRLYLYRIPSLSLLGCHLSNEQLKTILEIGCKRVYVMLDGDIAGQVATKQVAERLSAFFETYVCYLESKTDPDGLSEDQVKYYLNKSNKWLRNTEVYYELFTL